MTKFKRPPIYLASTDHEAVEADVRKIFAGWNGGRQTLRLRIDYSIIEPFTDDDGLDHSLIEPYLSGYRLDIIPIRDRVVTPAEYDEEGSVITPPEYAGETRIDIVTVEGFQEPELATEVDPDTPDSQYC